MMNRNYRKFGLVMSASFETIVLLFFAKWVADWLNERYPVDFKWLNATFLFALIMILYSWYVTFRALIKDDLKNASRKSEEK